MTKPILATNIDDLLIKHEAFIEPHKAWFDRAVEKTGDKSLNQWKGKENYFLGVNKAMKKMMPESSETERTKQAREWYQEDVIKYIKTHPEVIKKDVVEKLRKLKDKYSLALITTNTKDHIDRIIGAANLQNIYSVIIASSIDEEPEKSKLISKLIENHGKPKYYLTGKEEPEIIKRFNELGVKVIKVKDLPSI